MGHGAQRLRDPALAALNGVPFHLATWIARSMSGDMGSVGNKEGLFAIIEARPKSCHTRLKCAFASCVHFVDHTPSAGSA